MLTIEQLRARAKFWREKTVEAKWESVSIAQDMLLNAEAFEELAANREAQPVFFIEIEGDDRVNAGRIEGENRPDLGLLPDGINYLYTASPAPAVNASPDFETWFVEKYKQPERLVKNEDGTYKFAGVQMAFSAWVDGRAAMLAQPVSQSYKLPVELHNYDGGCVVFGAADDANEAPEGGNG